MQIYLQQRDLLDPISIDQVLRRLLRVSLVLFDDACHSYETARICYVFLVVMFVRSAWYGPNALL